MELSKKVDISTILELLNFYLICYESFDDMTLDMLANYRNILYSGRLNIKFLNTINNIKNRINYVIQNEIFKDNNNSFDDIYFKAKNYILYDKKYNNEKPIAIFTLDINSLFNSEYFK